MKTIDYSFIHPEEKWTGRANTLKQISDKTESRSEFQGKVKIDRDALQKVIFEEYPVELKSYKEKNELEKLDRHKVGALTTILVFRADLIRISEIDLNGYCIAARHLHSVLLGLSRIGNPEDLVSKNYASVASIYSQLHTGDVNVKSLANQFHLIEECGTKSKRQIT